MGSLSGVLAAEPVRSLAFGSVANDYVGVGSGFANPTRILLVQNLTNVALSFSMDGINDNWVLAAQGFMLLDIASNRELPVGSLEIRKGTRIYVRSLAGAGTLPTSGSVYVSVFYGYLN